MENGAKGCEIMVSGKLRAQRAKSMKFRDGYMIKSGNAAREYVDYAVRHLKMKQGVLGIKVKIMLPHDPTGKNGCPVPYSDVITVADPKPDPLPVQNAAASKQPYAENRLPADVMPAQQQMPQMPVVPVQ